MLQALAAGGLGVLLGMRHALEPDHLAAVSTLVARERSPRAGAMLGAMWGVGHTAALLAVGAILALARAEMPERLADVFELGVAVMLVGLGAAAIARALREGSSGPQTTHAHGARIIHTHSGSSDHLHVGGWTLAGRPLLVGIVHGLAGSGSLMAVALAGMQDGAARISSIGLFGFGSILGMTLLSGLAGWPLRRLAGNPRSRRLVSLAAGGFSAAFGLFWGFPLVARWIA